MKKLFALLICTLAIFALASCEKEPAYYLEPFNLTEAEEGIIKEIMKQDDITLITEEQLGAITKINIAGNNISMFKSLGNFEQDPESYFEFGNQKYYYSEGGLGNEISAIRVFKNMKDLNLFYLPELTDLNFLSELTNLEYFNIEMTNVTDLSCLNTMAELDTLVVECCPVETIELHPESKVSTLYVNYTNLSDASFLENADSVMKIISISDNQVPISEFESLTKIKVIEKLAINNPNLDLTFLRDMDSTPQTLLVNSEGLDLYKLEPIKSTLYKLTIKCDKVNRVDLTPLDDIEFEHLKEVIISGRDVEIIHGEKTKNGDIKVEERRSYIYKIRDWFSKECWKTPSATTPAT